MTTCPTCGQTKRTPRSSADHRRFFGVIQAAWQNWPESHPEQFDNAERLRHWLLIKAGYSKTTYVDADIKTTREAKALATAITSAMASAPTQPFLRVHGNRVAIFWPKSIKFDTLDQKAFGKVRELVEEVIEAETGMRAGDLLVEAA